ncbi:hypothetical protein [Thiocystis violacea]|uniref:hypothetical protein n=1 Tax=Thiocystis violacea TaxID=13725 RepID=UPI001905A9D0|nr:hypothetical protein [Thiocystis violacea]MBK1720036.1 hypothetical protein [Thiocystis violacea]
MLQASGVPDLVVFFGHHKCGSRYFRFSVMHAFAQANGYGFLGYRIQQPPFHFRSCQDLDLHNIDFQSLKRPGPLVLGLSNAGEAVVKRLQQTGRPYRGVRVLRDPRQLLVSNYFYHLVGHNIEFKGWVWDALIETRARLRSLDLEQGLLYELDHITADIMDTQILPWRTDWAVVEFKLETFNRELVDNMHTLARHCGFTDIPRIDVGNTTANPVTRHWRDVLTDRIKDVFKRRYGDWLINAGYAEDDQW